MFLSFNPVVALKVSDQLSVAAGPMLNYADLDTRCGLVVVGDEFRFRGVGFSPGFNAGLLWRPYERHTLGVNYRSATTVDFHGHTFVRNLTPAIPGLPPSGIQSASLEMPYPQHVTVGWSYRPAPAWNLELDVCWTDWDRLNTVTIRHPGGSIPEVFDWRSTFEPAAGVTRHFNNGYSVGGGFIWVNSAVPDAHFNPFVTDLAGPSFTLGLGRQGKRSSWNASYFVLYGLPRTVSGSALSPAGQSADGRYEGVVHFVCLSLGLKF
jgi:long-chain fatty acid transport protein